jgi:hypothetical protein
MAARSTPVPYTPAAGDTLIPGATAIHEFFGFLGDCGQAAAEIVYSWSKGQTPSGDHINAVVRAMQQAGLASGSGVSTLAGNSLELSREGIPNFTTHDWQGALQQYAGVRPIELFVNNARALPGDEVTVSGHFLTIEGRTASGNFVASDPDNALAKVNKLAVYTLQQLKNAATGGALVPTGGGPGIGIPPGGVIGEGAAQQGANAGGATAKTTADAVAGLQDALGKLPGQVADLLKPALFDIGLFTLALILLGAGLLLILWPEVSGAAKEGAKAAGAAAVVA